MKIKLGIIGLIGAISSLFTVFTSAFSTEQQEAYEYAYSKGVTTQTSIENANMNGSLTRVAMAKMISNYAITVLGLIPDTSKTCNFLDVTNSLDSQYNYGVTQACQLGLMGIGDDGNISKTFNPNGIVTRGQWATAFSRALNQSKGNIVEEGNPYYKNHMEYLSRQGIIKDVNNPSYKTEEKRGNVMIMMYRSDESKGKSQEDDGLFGELNDNNDGKYIEYYDNGQIKSELEYKDGKYNGKWIAYYNNGQIDTQGNYKNGKQIGEWISYYENGQIHDQVNYLDGNLNGKWLRYYENGQIDTQGNYKNGFFDGEYIEYYENGKLEYVCFFENGKQNGEYTGYFEDGSIRYKGKYKNGELLESMNYSQITGKIEWKKIYENGFVKEYISYGLNGYDSRRIYEVLDWDGKSPHEYWTGTYTSINSESGQIHLKQHISNGVEDGESIRYYANGQIEVQLNYKNGVKDGEYISYYIDGQISQKGNYKNGEKDGKWTSYYNDGSLKESVNYKN